MHPACLGFLVWKVKFVRAPVSRDHRILKELKFAECLKAVKAHGEFSRSAG